MLVGTVARAGIEELLVAVYIEDGDVVVELREAGEGLKKEVPVTIGDGHDVSLHAGRAGHGDEELCQLVAAAALVVPDVVGIVNLLEALRLHFSAGVLAGEVGV